MKATHPSWAYRVAIASRGVAAALGGYALASAAAAAGTRLLMLGWPRADAVVLATLLAWFVLAGAVAWAFRAESAWGAWAGLLAPALLLGGGTWLWPAGSTA